MVNNIQMVDLQGQYQRIKEEIDSAIATVVQSANYINGIDVKLFANNLANYLNVKHVIPVANGTDALQIALMSLGIGPGDEVITPNFTFIATVEAVALLGATPVLVDVNKDDFNIDTNKLESLITKKTKAILPVHLFGQCANMDAIMEIAKKHNLFVIEDTAQATGSEYKGNNYSGKAGTIGDFGCNSFFPSKNLGCFGDGGAIFTNNSDFASRAQMIANHGSKVKYYHELIGVNSRLDTIQAAVLNVKLKYLDEYNFQRQKSAEIYDKLFQNQEHIKIPHRNIFTTHIFHQYTILVPEGENVKLQTALKEKGIPSMIYYPVPIHQQKAFNQNNYDTYQFPVSNMLSKCVISLPMHTELTTEQQQFIANHVINYFRK
ncbi:MAG TPA: DegT/DnrJ/EryC1/StrS family aminotransferase [Salinivirgaceae bacterium]|nr:DegT/DnrJ/EryC1/StrS family aminotransferase [Salinivirgaceae bacterium]